MPLATSARPICSPAAGLRSTNHWCDASHGRSRRGPSRRSAFDPDVSSETADDPYDSLTERERQVLKLVAEGRSTKETASLLDISVKTAMTHREHVMQKLNLHNRTDLTLFAIRRGVIQET